MAEHQKLSDEKLEAMKRAYDDYPSQDNEGYVPDRAGFKAGFYAAWNLLHAENKELRIALETAADRLELMFQRNRALCDHAARIEEAKEFYEDAREALKKVEGKL